MPSNGTENDQWTAHYNPPAPFAYQSVTNQQAYYPYSWPIEGTATTHYNLPGPSAFLDGDVARVPSMPNAYRNAYAHPPFRNCQPFNKT